MRIVQDIVFGVSGQVLTFDAPEGRPSSVTSVTVFAHNSGDDDDEVEATTGSASVETNPNTTTDATCGASSADPRRIPLTATTGAAVDRTYLLADADGRKEWAQVREVDAADAVSAAHPLHNDYATGATFQSTRISIAVSATWVADDDNLDDTASPNPAYRVRWVYVVAGATVVADTYFSLVRYAGRHNVRPQDVDNFRANWLNDLPIDHKVDQGKRLIDEAYRDVKLDLAQVELDDAAIAEGELLDQLVRYKTVELTEYARFLANQVDDDARLRTAERKYTERFDALVRIKQRVPTRDSTGAAAPGRGLGITVR